MLSHLISILEKARDTVIVEAQRSVQKLAQLFTERLQAEKTEMEYFATVLRDNKRLREYLFITVEFDSGRELLIKHYNEQFSWLPIDQVSIIGRDGTVIQGVIHEKPRVFPENKEPSFAVRSNYIDTNHGLELVATAPILYKEKYIGSIKLAKRLDNHWLQAKTKNSIGELIVEKNGVVQYSTIRGYQLGQQLPSDGKLVFGNSIYRISPIRLQGFDSKSIKIWFGASFTEAQTLLLQHRNESIIQIVIGCLIIIILGWLIGRNFDQPLAQLASLTKQISSGHLPVIVKAQASTEIGALKNQFVDMIHALREKDEQVKRVHLELERIAVTDSLTGLNNRRAFEAKLSTIIYNTKNHDQQHALCFLDLDKFKVVNDTCGHEAGDELLRQITKLILSRIRTSDMFARLGGDEFGIILTNINQNDASIMANELIHLVYSYKFLWNDMEFSVGVSIGMVMLDTDCNDVIDVMRRADNSCYTAKHNGRNTLYVNPSQSSVISRIQTRANQ